MEEEEELGRGRRSGRGRRKGGGGWSGEGGGRRRKCSLWKMRVCYGFFLLFFFFAHLYFHWRSFAAEKKNMSRVARESKSQQL